MKAKKITTAHGAHWHMYAPTDEEKGCVDVNSDMALWLSVHPEAEWDGKKFVLPETEKEL
jgi:hypothetical protein